VSQESLIAKDLGSSSRGGRKVERMCLYMCMRAGGGGVLMLSREEFPALPSRFRESGSLVSFCPFDNTKPKFSRCAIQQRALFP
jgi:hypothetical protein